MRLVCVAVMLAGCDQAFGLEPVQPSDATGDGTTPGCTMPTQFDKFDGGEVCASWGYTLTGSSVEKLVGGDLVLQPKSASTNTGCVSAIPFAFGPSGVFVDVPAVGTGNLQYNGLQLFWTPAKDDSASITVSAGNIQFLSHAVAISMPYDAVAQRWWRLRPSADRLALIAETSPDGRRWTELGRDPVPASPMCEAQIQSGLPSGGSGPTEMHVASFDVCP